MLYICVNRALAPPVSVARLWRMCLLSSPSVLSIPYHTYLHPLTSSTAECSEHAVIFHVSGYLHIQLFLSILNATPNHWFFFGGGGKKTPIFSSISHTFKNYRLEIVLDLAKRLDHSSLNACTNSMKFLAFILYTML